VKFKTSQKRSRRKEGFRSRRGIATGGDRRILLHLRERDEASKTRQRTWGKGKTLLKISSGRLTRPRVCASELDKFSAGGVRMPGR